MLYPLSLIVFATFADLTLLLDDQSVSALNAKMNSLLPFAVVGSMDEIKVGNRMVRARQYPWGTVQVGRQNRLSLFNLEFRWKTMHTVISSISAR